MEIQEEFIAVLVIYDHDLTVTKRHSEGARYRRSFEKPYEMNLRVLPSLRTHIQALSVCKNKKVFFGVATLGEFEERIFESWKALGVEKEDLLVCAKFLDEQTLAEMGKYLHIVNILSQLYSKHPNVKIERIYVVDDSLAVINALEKFAELIKQSDLKDDPRFDITIEGILVPRPELEYEMIEVEGKLPRAVIKMHRDELLQANVCVELPFSERRLVDVLNLLEEKIDHEKKFRSLVGTLSESLKEKKAAQKKEQRSLAKSLDGMFVMQSRVKRELLNISNSSDSLGRSVYNSISDAEGEENKSCDDQENLFRSA